MKHRLAKLGDNLNKVAVVRGKTGRCGQVHGSFPEFARFTRGVSGLGVVSRPTMV